MQRIIANPRDRVAEYMPKPKFYCEMHQMRFQTKKGYSSHMRSFRYAPEHGLAATAPAPEQPATPMVRLTRGRPRNAPPEPPTPLALIRDALAGLQARAEAIAAALADHAALERERVQITEQIIALEQLLSTVMAPEPQQVNAHPARTRSAGHN